MKKYLFLLLLTTLLANCTTINLKDHYSVALCGDKACDYKPYEGRGSAILVTDYHYDYEKMMSLALTKAVNSCLIGYAIVKNHFPKDEDVFKFHWDNNIQSDYMLYIRLETFEQLDIEPPFNIKERDYGNTGPYETALIFFYVEKKRAINCYNPTKQFNLK